MVAKYLARGFSSGRTLLRGVGLISLFTFACDVDLGPRYVQPTRTFGEIVYSEVCERVAYTGELEQLQSGERTSLDASGVAYRPMCNFAESPPAGAPVVMQTVSAERQTLIDSVNAMVPDALLDPLNQTMQAMLPALDGPSAQKATVGGGDVLLGLAADPQAVSGLSRLSLRDGYRPPGTEAAAALGLLNYSDLYATLSATLPVLWSSSDASDDAPGSAERLALLRAVGREVAAATAVASPGALDRTMRLTLRFLFTENVELRTLPAGQSYWGVLRDSQGAPQINTPGGVLPTQYIDADKDGLPDLDADGHFKNSAGGSLADISPFPLLDTSQKDNAVGRSTDGLAYTTKTGPTTLYRYINLDDTVLAGLLRDTPALLDPQSDIPLRMASGIRYLLGPRQPAHKDYANQPGLDFSGFDDTQGPLLDILYSFIQILGYSDTGDGSGADLSHLLRGVYDLLRDQESVVARNMQAAALAFDESKKPAYAAAALAETSSLFDDLMPVLVRLLRVNGLLSDVLVAMEDPAVADLGELMAKDMGYSNYFFLNPSQLDSTQPNAVFGTLNRTVNRALPDSDIDLPMSDNNPQNNRSILQRVLHLVHDANGLQFCNKPNAKINNPIPLPGTYNACDLLRIDDLAVFYVLSMTSRAVKDNIPEADFLNAIQDSGLRTSMRLGGGGFLSSMLGIPGFNFVVVSILPPRDAVYPTPEAAARLLFEPNSVRTGFQQDAMDLGACSPQRPGTLCCNQNHSWQQQHDGALFALEVVKSTNGRTFYQSFSPLVDAFAKHQECSAYDANNNCTATRNAAKILVDLLAVLHRHWPTNQSKFYGLDYEAQNKKDGVANYEPLIGQILGKTSDLWPASLALAPVLLNTVIDDGSNLPLHVVVSNFARWFLDPQAKRLGGKLTYRDGRTAATRYDGTPTFAPTGDPFIKDVLSPLDQGKPTPYDLLADAFHKKRLYFANAPTIQTDWQGAVSKTADLYLSSRPNGAGFKFKDKYIRSIELALVDHIREREISHGAMGTMQSWVQKDLYSDISSALLGPVAAGMLDVLDRIAADPTARQKLPQMLGALLADPGPGQPDSPRFRGMLNMTADLLQFFIDDGDVVPILRTLGPAFDPDVGAADGALAIVRRGVPTDPNQVLIQIGKNLFKSDATGLYPAFRFGTILNEIDRQNAGQMGVLGSPLLDPDYQSIVKTVGQFLSDHQRGGARLVDIVQSRTLPQ